MEKSPYKIACAHCGEVIAYTTAGIGSTIQCPKCGESNHLSNPVAANPAEPIPLGPGEESAAAKRPRFCDKCGAPILEGQFECYVCKSLQRARRQRLAIFILIVSTLTANAVWSWKHPKTSDNTANSPNPSSPSARTNIAPPNSTNESKGGTH